MRLYLNYNKFWTAHDVDDILDEAKAISRTYKTYMCKRSEPVYLNTGLQFCAEIRTKRQDTLHDCLPRLLGDGDKGIEIAYGEEKIFSTKPTRAAKAEQKSLIPARQAQRTNQKQAAFICPYSP